MITFRATSLFVTLALWAMAPAIFGAENPPAEGFDLAGSDERAIEIADEVMEAMGGRENWDATRTLAWNFFGFRTHVWDRWTGDLRFEQQDRLVLMNVNSREGRAFDNGQELTDPAALQEALKGAYEAWINDSYWLLMPYKLKDSGVTLKYDREAETAEGKPAHVLQLTFENVGVTPDNKYDVFVAKDSHLVEQWSFYDNFADAEPRFSTPWANWQRHGSILLSGDRGERQLSDIRVLGELPASVFDSPSPIHLESLAAASP